MPRSAILTSVVFPVILALVVFVWTPGLRVRAAGPVRASEPLREVRAADGASPKALLDAFHALRLEPGAEARFAGLFHSQTAHRAAPLLARVGSDGPELARSLDGRGDLAHAFVTVASAADPARPAALLSLRLRREAGRWWLLDVERAPLP